MLPAFGWHAVLTQWEFAPVVTAATGAAAVAYLWGAWRVARRHPARPWPWWRTALFLSGLAVVVLATQSRIGAYDDVLAWDHMVQHLLLLMVAPPLLVAGHPAAACQPEPAAHLGQAGGPLPRRGVPHLAAVRPRRLLRHDRRYAPDR